MNVQVVARSIPKAFRSNCNITDEAGLAVPVFGPMEIEGLDAEDG